MAQVNLFISCVTSEFGLYRKVMQIDFDGPNLNARIQEDFIAGSFSTLQNLDEYIKNCEAIIHFCGDMTGSMANDLSLEYIRKTYPDFSKWFPWFTPVIKGEVKLSYTQWEAWLAAYHNKRLLIAIPTPGTHRDSAYICDAKQQRDQEVHLSQLRKHGHYPIKFSTSDELVKQLYRALFGIIPSLSKTKPINLPYHSIGSLFKGRNEEIDRLFTGVSASRSHADAIVGNALYGLGGIGKTKLAVEYAWRHKDDYTALLFVPADTPEKLASNLASLSNKTVLDLPEQDEQEERVRYEAVIRWLQQSSNWLLILDNADTKAAATRVESLFSKELHGGHVLITSRQANWSSQVNTLMLDVLNEGAATSFLLQRTDGKRRKTTDDDNLAFMIADDLGYLALALEQAAAYISKRKLTLSQYRVAWQLNYDEVLQWHDVQLMQYPTSVAVTWQTSVEELSTDAKLLLDMLAWLAPDSIPESLILTKASDEECFDKYASLIELSEYSLVNRSDEQPDFTVHRLVQDVTRKKQDEEKSRRIITACFHWIDKAFPDNPEDVRKWPVSEPLIQHVLELTTRRLYFILHKKVQCFYQRIES